MQSPEPVFQVVPPALAFQARQDRLRDLSQLCLDTLCSAAFPQGFRRQDFDCLLAAAEAALLSPAVWPTLISDAATTQLRAYNLAALSSLLKPAQPHLPFFDNWLRAIISLALFRIAEDSNDAVQDAAKVLAQLHLSIKLLLLCWEDPFELRWSASYLACMEEALQSTTSPVS